LFRTLSLAALFLGFTSAIGCGRTDLKAFVRGAGGSGGAGGTASPASTGGAGGAASGPCDEAACLASLFLTCVPEGSCVVQGGGSPSASFSDTCFSNGVSVFRVGSWNGSDAVTFDLAVRRNGVLCYSTRRTEPTSGDPISYVVTGADGQQVATGLADDDLAPVIVTCNGGKSTTISSACLEPTFDTSGCDSGTCP
jgi:hypothetical protein